MVKFPVTSLAELKNTPKLILCILSLDKDILPWSALIAESRRNGCTLNAQFHRIIEKLGNILSCFPLKQRTVHGNSEPFGDRNFYCFNRPVKYTILANRGIIDRKSTRLNSSHSSISYAVFCLKKKK